MSFCPLIKDECKGIECAWYKSNAGLEPGCCAIVDIAISLEAIYGVERNK